MSDSTRQCPFNGCDRMVPPQLFACGQHWYSLSALQRKAVYAMYTAWQNGQITGEELRRRQQAILDETAVGGTA